MKYLGFDKPLGRGCLDDLLPVDGEEVHAKGVGHQDQQREEDHHQGEVGHQGKHVLQPHGG